MSVCPRCDGQGSFRALVNRHGEIDPGPGCAWERVSCSMCGGTGRLTNDQAAAFEVGKRARVSRLRRGLTLAEEATRLGVDPVALSAYENGRGPKP